MRSLRDVLDFLRAVKENGGSIGYMKACEITPKGVVLPSLIEMGLLWKGTGKDRFNYLDWTWHLTKMGEDLLELEKDAKQFRKLQAHQYERAFESCPCPGDDCHQVGNLWWGRGLRDEGYADVATMIDDLPDVDTPQTTTCRCGRMELIWSGWLDTTVKGGLGQPKTCKCPDCNEVCKYPEEANRA